MQLCQKQKTFSKFFFPFLKFILCILLTTESRSARGASRHPAFMDGSLTVSQTCLPCPPCGKMRLQSWTVVMAINELSNILLNQSW